MDSSQERTFSTESSESDGSAALPRIDAKGHCALPDDHRDSCHPLRLGLSLVSGTRIAVLQQASRSPAPFYICEFAVQRFWRGD
jgi:hypothetical protein